VVPQDPTNFDAAKAFVAMNRRKSRESLSGPGSYIANTREVVAFVGDVVRRHSITSVLDLGCGDWNWMRKVDFSGATYIGWDCDQQMIAENNRRYGSDSVSFEVSDIASREYPQVDLIICRDVLFHMPHDVSMRVLRKAKNSSRYFMSTTFDRTEVNAEPGKYVDIEGWGFYRINLAKPPFSLAELEVSSVFERASRRRVAVYRWG
jgi:SAM-dependent methyltransferase